MTQSKKYSKVKKICFVLLVAFAVLFGAGFLYVNDYYHATETASALIEQPTSGVTVEYIKDDVLAFIPEEANAGLIFYPGGKVEYTAYAPLMHTLAQNGILCILPHMTCNLAVLEVNAADGFTDIFPNIECWYMGGHSLGGSMAATYLEKNAALFDGLLLCASYSTADLSGLDIEVLSIYGSEDLVLNAEKYDSYKTNLPSNYTEYVIEGGCHAYFGSYGAQEGDGTPTITESEQLAETVEFVISNFK